MIEKNLSLERSEKERAIVIRGGAIGDFILTIPLISYLEKIYTQVTIVSKASYYLLLNNEFPKVVFRDLNRGIEAIKEDIQGSDVYTFWFDEDLKKEIQNMGPRKIYFLPAKSENENHIVNSMFLASGFPVPSAEFLSKPFLGDYWRNGKKLWIHPGSGSLKKNMPISFFFELCKDWLKKNSSNKVIFSFGEADDKVFGDFKNNTFNCPDRVSHIFPESINDLGVELKKGVSFFWGNDSGPSHLAANLGIPTNVCYKVTDSAIWKPTGPRVKTHEFF